MTNESNRRALRASRLVRWARDGAVIVAVSLVLILGLEVVLRTFFPQHLTGTPLAPTAFSERDRLLGSRYVPGAHWRFTHPEYTVEYTINPHGFRDRRDHPIPKPEGRTRVLILGDSFTFGQGVDYDDLWTVRAERRLEAEGRSDVELVKVGLQGADQRSELILLQRLLDSTDSDVVVIVFLINDLYTNVPYEQELTETLAGAGTEGHPWGTDQFAAPADTAWEEMRERVYTDGGFLGRLHLLTLARRIVTSFDSGYNRLYLAAPGRGEYLRLPLGPEPRRQLEITERLFEQIAEYVRAQGKELVVLSLPQQFQVLYYHEAEDDESIDVALYDRHFAEVAAQNGFAWIATLDDFMESRHDPRRLFYRLDGHLTPEGNEVVADIFLRHVVPLLVDPREPAPGERRGEVTGRMEERP